MENTKLIEIASQLGFLKAQLFALEMVQKGYIDQGTTMSKDKSPMQGAIKFYTIQYNDIGLVIGSLKVQMHNMQNMINLELGLEIDPYGPRESSPNLSDESM